MQPADQSICVPFRRDALELFPASLRPWRLGPSLKVMPEAPAGAVRWQLSALGSQTPTHPQAS